MKKFGGVVEAIILCVLGGYAGSLVFSRNYWFYLNPKFKWLTAATAVMLMVTGTVALLHPNRRPSFSRIAVFLLFIGVCTIATYSGIPAVTPAQSVSRSQGAHDLEPRMTVDGIEYVRINLAELFMLGEHPTPAKMVEHYLARGIVKHSEQLDRSGRFALIRNMVTCCLADMVAVGFAVDDNHLSELPDGHWVELYGTLTRLSEPIPDPGIRLEGTRLVALNRSYALIPTRIVPIEEPEIPFIFEIREAEPYAY